MIDDGAALPHSYSVCGVPIAVVTATAAAERILRAALIGLPLEVHLCNAYTLSLVEEDEELRAALLSADLNLPDGAPVAWFGRRYGVRGPVRGSDLVRDVVRLGLPSGIRHYFYGGAEQVAREFADRLSTQFPGVDIVGTETPPYRELRSYELVDLCDRIVVARAQVVWVGLGTPRQDYLVPRLAEAVGAAVVPVGAAFDFFAGRTKEAPALLHGTGLEWLYRFGQEPGRLWHRYLVGNPRFLLSAARRRGYGQTSRPASSGPSHLLGHPRQARERTLTTARRPS